MIEHTIDFIHKEAFKCGLNCTLFHHICIEGMFSSTFGRFAKSVSEVDNLQQSEKNDVKW